MLIPLAPQLSEFFFGQPLTAGYVALLGAVAIVSYYQMSSGSLLNALGLQHLNVVTAVSAELVQLCLMYRWCARPTLGIYGYLLAMLLTSAGAFLINFCILQRHTGFAVRPLRRSGVPLLCGATLLCWTRIFYSVLQESLMNDIAALGATVCGAGLLYVVVLRLLGIRLILYLSRRIEKPQTPERLYVVDRLDKIPLNG